MTVFISALFALALLLILKTFSVAWSTGLAAAFALVAWQAQSALRAVFIARTRFRSAVPGDAVSWLGQAVLILGYVIVGGNSPTTVFLIIGCTSVAAALLQARQLRIRLIPNFGAGAGRMFVSFANSGKWVLASNLVSALMSQSLILTLAASSGTGSVAEYQAMATILGVSHPIILTLSNLLLPTVSASNAESGTGHATFRAFETSIPFLALLLPAFLVLLLIPDSVLALVYGQSSPYGSLATPLRIFTVAYMLFFCVTIISGILNGLSRSGWNLVAQLLGSIASIAVGVNLTLAYGVIGATIGLLVSFAVWTLAGSTFVARLHSISRTPVVSVKSGGIH